MASVSATGNIVGHWQAYIDATTSQSNTAVTVSGLAAGAASINWGYQIYNVSATLGYDGTGGSGSESTTFYFYAANSTDTKCPAFSGKSYTLTRGTSAYTQHYYCKIVNNQGYEDGTSQADLYVTVPVLDSWTVSYNANGGTGAPSSQTKYYGKTLTLSTTKPTRSGYTFAGWATSSTGSVAYAAGASYTANAALTLYAVWTLDHTRPTISSVTATRCTSSGTASDSGTYASVVVKWSTSDGYKCTSVKATANSQSTSATPNATSGTTTLIVGAGKLDTSTQYTVTVTITDAASSNNTSTATTTLPTSNFVLRAKPNNGGLLIGVPASTTKSFTASSGITIGSTAISSSDAVHIASLNRRCNFGPNTSSYTNQWYKFASCTLPNTNEDRKLILLVSLALSVNSSAGILVATVRSQTGSDVPIYPRLSWLAMESSNTISLQPNNWVMAYSTTAPFTIELWHKATSSWHTWSAVVLDDSNRTTPGQYWTLYNDKTGSSSVTSGYTELASTYDPPVKIATVKASINKTDEQLIGSVTAPTVSGYTFLTWIQFSSTGWAGSPYPEFANQATTKIYDIHGSSATSSCSVFCVAMYTRSY